MRILEEHPVVCVVALLVFAQVACQQPVVGALIVLAVLLALFWVPPGSRRDEDD